MEVENTPSAETDESLYVTVPKAQLSEILHNNAMYKTEIIAMVKVFGVFTKIMEGKGLTQLAFILPKLIKDKTLMESIAALAPIVDKYTQSAETDAKEE